MPVLREIGLVTMELERTRVALIAQLPGPQPAFEQESPPVGRGRGQRLARKTQPVDYVPDKPADDSPGRQATWLRPAH